MANIKSFPNNQDVYIGAEDVMKWLHGRTSGVFGAENNASVAAVQGEMAVTVSDGIGWMAGTGKDGIVWWNDHEAVNGTKLKLAFDPADSTLNRFDRIIVEWKTTNYVDLPEVKVLKGSLSSKATAPELTNNSTLRQISLAKINIAAGTTAITASMITDERLDPAVCGIVTESVSIDTSVMQNQFEALLTAIQQELQNLNAGTAALLKTGDTMQGTLDMGGNKIQNVAAPKNESDAVNKKFVDDALANFESGMSMELRWKNASPTSAFPAQTLQLDLSGGTHVMVGYKPVAGAPTTVLYAVLKIGDTTRLESIRPTDSYYKFSAMSRDISIRQDSIIFYSGIESTAVSAPAENDNYMTVVEIYLIKGVSA